MEEMDSVWNYQESIDELNHRILYATSELESARTNANDEIRRAEENVKHLLEHLKVAYRERDEARDQLQTLLNNLMSSSPTEICPVLPNLQHISPTTNPAKGNPSIAESISHQSYVSSPVDSFFGQAPLLNLSSTNIADLGNVGVPHQPFIITSRSTKTDPDLAVIEHLVRGKVLPQKGRLLQAVMEAGPLLETLLLSGSLPRWRNPPPLQPLQIPLIPIKSCDSERIIQKQVSTPNNHLQNPLSLSSYSEISYGLPQICCSSLLNFTSSCSSFETLNKELVRSSSVRRDFMHDLIPNEKRQRSQ